jgi:hypothetical protein
MNLCKNNKEFLLRLLLFYVTYSVLTYDNEQKKGRGYLPGPLRLLRTYLPGPLRFLRTYLPGPLRLLRP